MEKSRKDADRTALVKKKAEEELKRKMKTREPSREQRGESRHREHRAGQELAKEEPLSHLAAQLVAALGQGEASRKRKGSSNRDPPDTPAPNVGPAVAAAARPDAGPECVGGEGESGSKRRRVWEGATVVGAAVSERHDV